MTTTVGPIARALMEHPGYLDEFAIRDVELEFAGRLLAFEQQYADHMARLDLLARIAARIADFRRRHPVEEK